MESILKRYFGFSTFRPYQKEVIEKILEKRDCLVVMATGSGKSLCYQIPPLVVGKTGVVVSPLISLMQDQVMTLKQRGIRAEYLGSTQTDQTVQTKAEKGQFNILYMTPEKACLIPTSFWVEYKQLDKLRDILIDVPFIGLTATATEKVRADIIISVKMNDPYVSIGSFDRNNLFYGVKSFNRGSIFLDELVQEVSNFVARSGSTIIYCTTIKDVEQISRSLQEAGIRAGIYHGQMDKRAREESHRLFVRDELQVMVATVAFGMGIDKPNIRQVIHYGCPKSLESYYQESGRCGRDGIASVCWLYYTRSDFAKGDFYCGESQNAKQRRAVLESLMAAQRYCLLTTCRRKFLLEHFGEKLSADRCGNFLRGSRSKKILDAQFDKLPLHGLGKAYSSNWWKALAHQLISYGYLKEIVSDGYRTISVSPKGEGFLASAMPDCQPPLVLSVTSEMIDEEVEEPKSTPAAAGDFKSLATSEFEGFSEAEVQLYQMLLEERLKIARCIGTAPYAICGDQTIKKIALTRPSTKARLANIDGVNQHLLVMHGDHFVQIILTLSQRLNLSLDGEASLQTAAVGRVSPLTNQPKKLTPAKFEAWKMWHKDGLSIEMIANFPGRSAPIKEQSVGEYLLEAAQEGLPFDWNRYCDMIGLTCEIFSEIQGAISKVGSTEKLKPIKNEVPEDISYLHIKSCLAMQNSGVSPEAILPSRHQNGKDGELPSDTSERNDKTTSEPNTGGQKQMLHSVSEEDQLSKKRLKVGQPGEGNPVNLEATGSSMVDWLKNYEEGVTLFNIREHFNGSSEESLVEILNGLEGDFLIYIKNNVYKLL
ncbi:ATP-dependent DNA helicase [Quillaja saponaria]|uniref:DNA 3'-5' helicase n=1 Tax=Quillaja saponaria TaxID=32244 RepID=A0AAD7LUL4_QUISA|nr:ATP-dependent DNA helicase [Quillaja saponaria]